MSGSIRYPFATSVAYYPIMSRGFVNRVMTVPKADNIFLIMEKSQPLDRKLIYKLNDKERGTYIWDVCDTRINRQDVLVMKSDSIGSMEFPDKGTFSVDDAKVPFGMFTIKGVNSLAKLENLERVGGTEVEPTKSKVNEYEIKYEYDKLPEETVYARIVLPQSLDNVVNIELIVDNNLYLIYSLFEAFLLLGRDDIKYEQWIEKPYLLVRNVKGLTRIQIRYTTNTGEPLEIEKNLYCYKRYSQPNKLVPIKKLIDESNLTHSEMDSLYYQIGTILGKHENKYPKRKRFNY